MIEPGVLFPMKPEYERAEYIADNDILHHECFNKHAVDSIISYVNWKKVKHHKAQSKAMHKDVLYTLLMDFDTGFKEQYMRYMDARDGYYGDKYFTRFLFPMHKDRRRIIRLWKKYHNVAKLTDELYYSRDEIITVLKEWRYAIREERKILESMTINHLERFNKETPSIDYPVYLVGRKGLGKTFLAKYAKALLQKHGMNVKMLKFSNDVFVDIDTNKPLDPMNIPQDLDGLFLDDIHLMLEQAVSSRSILEKNLALMKKLYYLPTQGTMVLFISEFPLWYYQKAINDPEYDHMVQIIEHSELSPLIMNEVLAPTPFDIQNMLKRYTIPYDKLAILIAYLIKPNCRAILRLAYMLGGLTYTQMARKAKLLIKSSDMVLHNHYNMTNTILSLLEKDKDIVGRVSHMRLDPKLQKYYTGYGGSYILAEHYQYILTKPFELAFASILNYGLESPILEQIMLHAK